MNALASKAGSSDTSFQQSQIGVQWTENFLPLVNRIDEISTNRKDFVKALTLI